MQGIVIAGTHSGCGKTTITLGLLAALRKKGAVVQPFKAGPDFIDTGLHGMITGRRSRNLDLWMCGEEYVKACFERHATDADIAVVEGVMGMYDGEFSTARLAEVLGLPVVLIVDAYGMAESAGAVVKGFTEFGVKSYELSEECKKINTSNSKLLTLYSKLLFAGVIFNRVGSERHFRRLKDGVQDIPVLGYMPRDLQFKIPHRHLGLQVAEENPIAHDGIDKLADAVLEYIDVDEILRGAGGQGDKLRVKSHELRVKKPEELEMQDSKLQTRNSKPRIAVAYDRAFCFYYEDNLDMLIEAGAGIVRFSPLADSSLPDDIDAVYIGGGYPELYAKELSWNSSMLESIRNFAMHGGSVYAECGGFMYLTEGIYDFDGNFHRMAGVFPFKTSMKKGRASLGYREIELNADCMLGRKGETIRGHEFHYSEVENSGQRSEGSGQSVDLTYLVKDGSGNEINREGYRIRNTIGSYIHLHFGSNRRAAKNFIQSIKEIHGIYSARGSRKS
jgi:cobyrinic acid a,c-diamide synthase